MFKKSLNETNFSAPAVSHSANDDVETIVISAEKEKDGVNVKVRDDGVGFGPEGVGQERGVGPGE